ncbi:hypothetical protein [Thioclava indica]|uniref:Uncharacterized protein n=1 Tax=Thioclava indica TaxID=1353528 RepID=A0A074JT37_9RHOB|nr:hypothetical protein [Thioclava indica]KEO60851.1 hypothetical protein DT23_11560 [Thioclava indica]
MAKRDDFSAPVIRTIAQRAGYRCSNQTCLCPTIGPDGADESASIGVAAHITAAAEGGPRYDSTLTAEERAAAENGIWLCQTCSRLIDVDVTSHSIDQLREWKTLAEMRAYLGIRGFAIVVSRSFQKLEDKMPSLVAEMRGDIASAPFTREFIIGSKNWSYNGDPENPIFQYYFVDHDNLKPMLKVMQNYDAINDTTYNNVDRFEFTEEFAEYLLLPV